MIKFKDVKNQTTEEYFNGNQFSIDAFNKKYALFEGETVVQAIKRICDYIASVEKDESTRQYWSERWFDEIYNDWWKPAGSIWQGAASGRKVSLSNCTTISLGSVDEGQEWDNLESIIRNTGYTVAKTAAYRQGLGVDFSRLRPRGTEVTNSAKESTGAVHWMKFIDSIGYYVGQKGRVPAMLFSLHINHPDVLEFINSKKDFTNIQNANISVQITKEFYNAVKNDEDWEMKFVVPAVKVGDKVYVDVHSATLTTLKDEQGYYNIATKAKKKEVFTRTEKARKILELIAKNMYAFAEPGIQNIDIAREYSNSDAVYDPSAEHDSRIISTNACSEQYLSRESLCVLGSINAGRFSTTPNEYIKELSIIGESINRFLDNVNECELVYQTYATPHQKIAIENLRRTGAGITNLAGWLFKTNMVYGTAEGNALVEDFGKWYNYFLYKSSIVLGHEKGSFKLFNKEKLKTSKFIKHMLKIHPDLEFDALRNVTCSSIAPTGTLSLMFRNMVMSYGVEPAFGMYFWKRTRISGKYEYYFIVPEIVRTVFEQAGLPIPMKTDTIRDTWDGANGKPIVEFIEKNKKKVGIHFKSATEIKPLDKLDLMARLMKHVDSSISVTYLLPEKTNWKDVYDFILEANDRGVKSIAAFPDKQMYGIVSFIPFKDLALSLKNAGVSIHAQNFSPDEAAALDIVDAEVVDIKHATKRPSRLPADIYGVTVKGEKFCIVVGLLNGKPYEIFGGTMNGLGFKFQHKTGYVEKVKRGHYKLEIGEDIVIEDFGQHFTPVEQILFRLTSTSLRHGVPTKYIVEQLSKASDDMGSLTAAASRVLKKYVADGEEVTGQKCLSCGSQSLVYTEGCVTCNQCSWSKCT